MLSPLRLTAVHDRLLRSTGQLHLVTAEQLCRLHYSGGSLTYVKALLKVLSDHGYVLADAIPTKQYKSPYFYGLSPRGERYLRSTGVEVAAAKTIDRHALFIRHTLELNDVLIGAGQITRANPHYRLQGFHHERELKRRPIKLERYTLIPDAFLDFRRAERLRLPVLLEHDRGTEGEAHFKQKIRAYGALLDSGAYREIFQVKTIVVAVTTFTGDTRALQLRQWTHEVTDHSQRFWFANLTQPPDPSVWLDPVWRTPTSDYQPLLA